MNKKISSLIILLMLYASLAGVLACTKTEHQSIQGGGGQDSGGGNTTQSTIEDVEFYYSKATKGLDNILYAFLTSVFNNPNKQALIDSLYTKVEEISGSTSVTDGIKILIGKSNIIIKKDGPCKSVDKVHAAGSIKEFKVGSPICISFTELSKLPKSSLEKEIISLLLHEYNHALGFEEKEAAELQRMLVQNFDIIFYKGTNKFIKFEYRGGGILSNDTLEKVFDKDLIEEALTLLLSNKKFNQKEWRYITMLVFSIEKISELYQDNDIHIYANLGTLFVNLKRITFEEIDAHLESVDQLRYKLKMDSDELAHLCANTTTQQSRKEMKVLAKRLQINFSKFIEAIDKTEEYLTLD